MAREAQLRAESDTKASCGREKLLAGQLAQTREHLASQAGLLRGPGGTASGIHISGESSSRGGKSTNSVVVAAREADLQGALTAAQLMLTSARDEAVAQKKHTAQFRAIARANEEALKRAAIAANTWKADQASKLGKMATEIEELRIALRKERDALKIGTAELVVTRSTLENEVLFDHNVAIATFPDY